MVTLVRWPVLQTIVLSLAICGSAAAQEKPAASHVGSELCASCHEGEVQAWRDSHHAGAMQVATRQTVLAPFAGETVEADGGSTTFSQRDGTFVITTNGGVRDWRLPAVFPRVRTSKIPETGRILMPSF